VSQVDLAPLVAQARRKASVPILAGPGTQLLGLFGLQRSGTPNAQAAIAHPAQAWARHVLMPTGDNQGGADAAVGVAGHRYGGGKKCPPADKTTN
jgi:cation transport ATPase